MASMSDANWVQTLVARVQAGDQAAFVALVERYHYRFKMLIQVGMSERLQQHYQPEDVLQEFYLKVFPAIREGFEWRGTGSFLKWMDKLLDHVLADLGRRINAQIRGGPTLSMVPLDGADGHDLREMLAASDLSPGTILRR